MGMQETGAFISAFVRGVKNRIMFFFEERRTLNGHGTGNEFIGCFNFGGFKSETSEQIKVFILELAFTETQFLYGILTQGKGVEHKINIEGSFKLRFHKIQIGFGKSFGRKCLVIDEWCVL